jgi:hypothetical protein
VATLALIDAFVHIAGYDFTCDANELMLSADAEALDVTTFCSAGWKTHIAGLKTSTLSVAGFFDSAVDQAPDPQIFPKLGTLDEVVTVGDVNTEAQVAFLAKLGKFSYQHGGAINQVYPFSVSAQGTGNPGVVRGQLAAKKQTVAATGATGTVVNLGSASGKTVYASLHVFTRGTTITVDVEADSAANFPSPTTVATFNGGAITATGGYWLTPTAGTSDAYYRLNVTAVTGSHSIAGAIAVV